MSKYEEMIELDKDNFFACWFFAEIVQFGLMFNLWGSCVGII